jgi:hypothetical protein
MEQWTTISEEEALTIDRGLHVDDLVKNARFEPVYFVSGATR